MHLSYQFLIELFLFTKRRFYSITVTLFVAIMFILAVQPLETLSVLAFV